MALIDTHPELPQLPEGQFFRIYVKDQMIKFLHVELRERTGRKRWFASRQLEDMHVVYDPIDSNPRDDAKSLAYRIVRHRAKRQSNVLGDLEGDHPS